MINVSDVIYAVMREVKLCKPDSKHYLGSIPENVKRPSFLFLMSFLKDVKSNYFTKDRSVSIQIIYFGTLDSDGKDEYKDKLKTMEELDSFLSKLNLNVKDRNLKFEYGFEEADEQLSINLDFKFKDGVVNTEYDEDQTRDMIQNIFFNDKERI